jgi:hypothetical protein
LTALNESIEYQHLIQFNVLTTWNDTNHLPVSVVWPLERMTSGM